MSQHIQVGNKCVAGVHIHVVTTTPEKTLTVFHHFNTFKGYASFCKFINFVLRKISTDDGHLFDIVAKIGRRAVSQVLPKLKSENQIDFVIAQAENMSTGNGITKKSLKEMQDAGVDFFTGGNHSFKKPEGLELMEDPKNNIIRPANYPEDTPGRGWQIAETPFGKVLVINVLGQTFNGPELKHPIRTIDEILELNKDEKISASLVDFHGDLTSEKVAIGFYLDRKSVV